MRVTSLLVSLSFLSSSLAFSAQCKQGPEAYGAGSERSPKVEPPAAAAVIPGRCNKAPCDIEIPMPDLLPPPPEEKSYEIIRIDETDGKETRVLSLVDKNQEKEAAKEASEKATKEAEAAAKEAERQEKEATEAQEKADREAQDAATVEEAAEAAEAERKAAKEQQEAEAARKEADKKAAKAQEASPQDTPPPEDDGGGLSTDDNIRPLNDIKDPQVEAEAKNKKDKEAYAQGKGKLDCSNPKVQCVNSELPSKDPANVLQITVPIIKNGVDCRYSRCDGEMDLATVDKANSLVNQVNDICRYSECMSEPLEVKGAEDDCGPLGKLHQPIKVPINLDKAILAALKDSGLSVVKIDKKPFPANPGKTQILAPRP